MGHWRLNGSRFKRLSRSTNPRISRLRSPSPSRRKRSQEGISFTSARFDQINSRDLKSAIGQRYAAHPVWRGREGRGGQEEEGSWTINN